MNMKLIGLVMVSLLVFGLGVGGAIYTLEQQGQSQPLVKVQDPTPVNNTTPVTHKVEQEPISTVKAHHLAQGYVNNDYGQGCSVAYPDKQGSNYHMVIYGGNGDYVGDVYINAYTGKLVSIKWLHD